MTSFADAIGLREARYPPPRAGRIRVVGNRFKMDFSLAQTNYAEKFCDNYQ
jgi:hypothetical protein